MTVAPRRGPWPTVAGLGIALGLLIAVALSRILAGTLYGVSGADPWSYAFVVTALLGAVLLASYLPARRAGATDPMAALRCE